MMKKLIRGLVNGLRNKKMDYSTAQVLSVSVRLK